MRSFATVWKQVPGAIALALVAATVALSQARSHAPADTSNVAVAITEVTVINVVTGEKLTGVTVLTEDGRITAIGQPGRRKPEIPHSGPLGYA